MDFGAFCELEPGLLLYFIQVSLAGVKKYISKNVQNWRRD